MSSIFFLVSTKACNSESTCRLISRLCWISNSTSSLQVCLKASRLMILARWSEWFLDNYFVNSSSLSSKFLYSILASHHFLSISFFISSARALSPFRALIACCIVSNKLAELSKAYYSPLILSLQSVMEFQLFIHSVFMFSVISLSFLRSPHISLI